jgi:hypothetical protein
MKGELVSFVSDKIVLLMHYNILKFLCVKTSLFNFFFFFFLFCNRSTLYPLLQFEIKYCDSDFQNLISKFFTFVSHMLYRIFTDEIFLFLNLCFMGVTTQ